MHGETENDRINAKRWFGVSIGSLMLAGCFSLALVFARMPVFSDWITDPDFFKRCLVVHVDLALIVWFYAFMAALFQMVGTKTGSSHMAARGVYPAIFGVILMVLSAGVPHAEPVLANYVPVVDHPLFIGGLVLFGFGVLLSIVSPRLIGDDHQGFFPIFQDARIGLKAMGVLLIGAAVTFYGAWLTTPPILGNAAYYELVAWGGGHVLQAVSETAMVSVWLMLLGSLLGRPILSSRSATLLFALLVTPHLAMPAITMGGTQSPLYYNGATQLMRWGIFPAVLLILGFCVHAIVKAWRLGELKKFYDPRLIGFATSASLTVTGFILGAMIRDSNTMIPAHYHAAIGAVTVSFMTVAILLLDPHAFGVKATPLLSPDVPEYGTTRSEFLPAINPRWIRLQPVLFGFGQLIFAIGFALAGAHGMGRKVYGAEQTVRGFWDWAGLGIMGVGGIVAVFGGILFLMIVTRAMTPLLRQFAQHFQSPLKSEISDSPRRPV